MEKKSKKKIYKSLQLPRRPGVAEAAHSVLDASTYRLSNVEQHFNNCVVDLQNSDPHWSLYRYVESSVATEFSVFVTGLCRSMQSSIETNYLGLFLDSIVTNFYNVTT